MHIKDRRSMKTTVKARVHYGADSLDLTIPVEIRRKYKIEPGDIFEVAMEADEENNLILKYKLVYSKYENR